MALQQSFSEGLRELALFSGAGGGILGGVLLGWKTVCAVEINAFCARRLLQRQNEGHLPPFPIWDDVCTFDGRPWQGLVDVVSGGFPCTDISAANPAGRGIQGERSGLWTEMARIIGEVRPRFAFVENSPLLTRRGIDVVLGGLAEMGYDARWGVLGAYQAGAPHKRERIWIVAYPMLTRSSSEQTIRKSESAKANSACSSSIESKDVADTNNQRLQTCQQNRSIRISTKETQNNSSTTTSSGNRTKPDWWKSEPDVGRVAYGMAARVDRLKAIGNGQVPAVVELAWKVLSDR